MSDDLATLIGSLNTARALLGEEIYQAKLAELRATHGSAVDAILNAGLTASGGTTQLVSGTSRTGAAVAGSVYGNIYVNGQWTRDEATLVRQYLERLAARCDTLPLQGIREQKASTDVLAIKLDRVYTQLATTATVRRETFKGEALRRFEAESYLRAHQGNQVQPSEQRLRVGGERKRKRGSDNDPVHIVAGGTTLLAASTADTFEFVHDLARWSSHELAAAAKQVDRLIFFGPQLVTEAIAEQNRLVLLGEPGSGKSTALRYLTLTLAEAGLQKHVDLTERLHGWDTLGTHQRPLPFFFPLLTFAQRLAKDSSLAGTANDLWNALADFIDPAASSTGLATAIRDRLHSGDVLLLLDGLDEVATVESRRKVVQAVQQFAAEFPQCRIVVTCRVRAYEGERNSAWQLAGWPTAKLADWTQAQMAYFVGAWYHEAAEASKRPDTWREERVAALNTAIVRRADLQRLGTRPLLLTIMALVHFNDGRLPEDSVSLYRRCIEILLGQWELARADGSAYGTLMDYIGLPSSGVETLRPLLQEAAFHAHEAKTDTDQGAISSSTLRLLVMDALKERGHPNPFHGAEKFLDYTDKRAGLMQASDAGDAYVFPHLTFQEYLAGVHLTSGLGVVGKIMARRNEDRWRVPIILGVGDHVSGNKLEMPYRLFDELLAGEERSPEQAQRDLLFAADLGRELGWDRLEQGDQAFKRVRQRLAVQLSAVVEGAVLPTAERVRAGVYLGEIGDPRPGVCTLPPTMIPIAGGMFVIGHTQAELDALRATLPEQQRNWFDNTLNEQPVTVDPFAIGQYPVTNAQFKLFMDNDGYNLDAPWWDDAGRAWLVGQRHRRAPDDWNDPRFGIARPNHPVVGVTWYEAQAFCRWLTQHPRSNPGGLVYRLPTEAEWEWAARGWERRSYPWDDAEPDGERANYGGTHDGTTAVGSFPDGAMPEGVLDLAGNVWEWTGSVYAPYPYEPDDGREQLTSVADKRFTLRGGSWGYASICLRAAFRVDLSPGLWVNSIGFRLATHLPV